MYDREYRGKELQFEASGGLIHSSLVMQDKQTDSYWALMRGEAIAGRFKGTRLRELAVGEKTLWMDWRQRHPGTLVLSVNGLEHIESDAFAGYFKSVEGFRGEKARDPRLATKDPIFAFRWKGQAYAIPYLAFEGGATVSIDGQTLLLYRPEGAELFDSTRAFVLPHGSYQKKEGAWVEAATGASFNPVTGQFEGLPQSLELNGFDTFWYNWSLANPGTRVLK